MRSLHIDTRLALQGLVAAGSAVLLTAGVTSGAVQARATGARTVTAERPVAAATWEPCPLPDRQLSSSARRWRYRSTTRIPTGR